ncbi:xanthine dehydrogenase family protein molybdopterin-binding subunit [Amylibacter sp. SFDW26]|uniref:xanthine dehydrogenase family protein molybdopterin-binding subunit n=1 Tax=Amylibacter sp. SFDW26 TaxID=2652722 RepID=UPI001262A0BE|nr:molybdopterin cofactor-binding domain-containing protein [Amylibacter sp. SFDW26]KAB7615993.1 xanthine dehydrogenase family protein molybdopterin-binding subunit [Amylibacter sp. SFDW26]
MGRIKTIARRTFLIGSAAIVGGVAFGYYAYKKPITNPLLDDLAEGEAAITPYVRIDQSGVTIITPRADKGQGTYSIQAALVAEELDIAWENIQVDPGKPSPAYYNEKVVAEGLPFAAVDDGFMARNARAFGGVIGKLIGLQVTGGSSTVPDAYEKMRVAGAIARETLLLAAAKQSGIARDQLKTKDGSVILPDGTSLAYTELAQTAAEIDPPSEVTLKPESEWRYIGKEMPRIDMLAKSTGTLTYGIDMKLDGMVHASVRTNPRIGGGVNSYDDSIAKTMRGVQKIIPITGGAGVIADNTWRAIQAVNAIEFDWKDAPYPKTSSLMWKNVKSSLKDDYRDSRFKDDGDVEKSFKNSNVIKAEYRIPHLAHAPLEPMNAIALLKDGRLDIWTGTQMPINLMQTAEKMTGIPAENIHIHAQMMGGSFGRRLEDDFARQAIELAQAMEGTPVKMTWSREEDMTHDFPRPMQMSSAWGTVKDGKVESYDLAIAAASTTTSQLSRAGIPAVGPDIAIVAAAWDQPFAIPNHRVTGYRVPEMVPISSWRSVGASGNGFLYNAFLDELIHAAGADPLMERLRLCNHDLSRKTLEAVGEMSNWGSDLGVNRFRGLAFSLSFGVPVAEVIEITNTEDGIKLDKVYVACEVGKVLDPINFENQVQGGVIWGLGHAMAAELTYDDGVPEQTNYDGYESMRLYQAPEIIVHGLENGTDVRGIGEPPVPPAAPALAAAIFAATGKRIRELPMSNTVDFV